MTRRHYGELRGIGKNMRWEKTKAENLEANLIIESIESNTTILYWELYIISTIHTYSAQY